jgi:subtilase-type serine protease
LDINRVVSFAAGAEEDFAVLHEIRGFACVALGATALALTSCSTNAPLGPLLQPLIAPAGTFPTTTRSAPTGIVGNLVTDSVVLANGTTVGALYDLASTIWTPIEMPGASSTAAYGPAITTAGYRVVGSYQRPGAQNNHGFVYDSGTNAFTTLDPPAVFCAPRGCNQTIVHSNFGSTSFEAVGNCDSVGGVGPGLGVYPATGHAFLYDSASESYTRIDLPGALSTTAYGIWIDGAEVAIAGGYTRALRTHAYVRGLTSGRIVTYDYPGAVVTHFEGITGAGGAGNYNVIGDATQSASASATPTGFFLPFRNWVAGTPIVIRSGLSANSVFGRTVVGITIDASTTAGYITTL